MHLLLVVISSLSLAYGLDISAFNIQVFGRSKMGKPEVVQSLINILPRYDIVCIQEIRDSSQTAIVDLLNQVNAACNDCFQMELSGRLGRTSSKEQYAFFYKSSVTIEDTYQWPDSSDKFERPPYIVRFRSGGMSFGYAGIHVKPDDAVSENDALVDVYDGMVSQWGLEDMIIGGDFNADCSYVRAGDWENIRLWTDSRFQWVIATGVDTTLASSVCTYDRLVLAGSRLRGSYQGGSGNAYYFDSDLGLSNDEAKEVSDHYPVKMVINP